MNTIIKKINFENTEDARKENKEIYEIAGEIIKKGGLVGFPTETVYGLGANALDAEAAAKIYAAKGRPSDNPLIVHIAEMKALEPIVEEVPEAAYKIADAFWPGPLSMIFKKKPIVPDGTTGGINTVAIRMPSNEVARQLILVGGGYIAAPSANTSGRPSPTTAAHVEEDLSGRIDMIIDGGAVDIGVESTVLDMTVEPPMILRPGAITKEMLETVVPKVTADPTLMEVKKDQKPKAPGMKYRHYAPKASLSIVEGSAEKVISEINKMAAEKIKEGARVGIIATDETLADYPAGDVKSIGSRTDEASIARHLFGILREFDTDQVDYIYSEAFSTGGIGSAVMNRLLKAAGHHVIYV